MVNIENEVATMYTVNSLMKKFNIVIEFVYSSAR
jgi:hypothetical protein